MNDAPEMTGRVCEKPNERDAALIWMANVLVAFAEAEQSIGSLARSLGYPTKNGALTSLNKLRQRLEEVGEKKL